jgi:hypothetical protein
VTKGITIRGAGTNQTIITRTGAEAIKVKLTATAPIRITDIAFVGNWSFPIIRLNGSGVSDAGAKITDFRIDHCKFTMGGRAVNPRGWCYGVVDHCTFINSSIAVGITGDNNAAWLRPIEPGSINAVYIEDNVFVIDNGAPSDPDEQVYHQEGGRSVTRFNFFNGTAATSRNSLFYDSHGNQNYYTGTSSDFRGQPLIEIYGNTFAAHHTYRLLYLRGGSALVYSNAFTYVTSGPTHIANLTEEEGWQTAFFNPLRTEWPAQDQITNTFFWANTYNGNPVTAIKLHVPSSDTIFIQQNRDYWMQAPNATNGSPAGIYQNYTPLVYPHPLVTVQAPTNLVVRRGGGQ